MEADEGGGGSLPLRLPGHPHRVQVGGVQHHIDQVGLHPHQLQVEGGGYIAQLYIILTKCNFILTGNRPALTYLACLRSLLRIHNETVNIW